MTTLFDWEQYQTKETPTKDVSTDEFKWDKFPSSLPPTKEEPITTDIEQAVKGLGRVGARGAVSFLAAPAKGIGSFLEFLSLMGKEGEPGQIRGMGTRALRSLGEYFQTIGKEGQEQLKQDIEKVLGKSYGTTEEALTKFVERATDIYGRFPMRGFAIPSVIAGGMGQIAEEAGLSPEAQEAFEMVGFLGKDILTGLKSLLKRPDVAKSGLILPKFVEKQVEKLKGVKAKVFSGKKEKLYKDISLQAEELISKIKQEKLPLAKEIEEGIDVSARNRENLNQIELLAKKMPNKIESKLISDYLSEIENSIKTGVVPTTEQEQILKIIDKYKKKFGEMEGAVRFYSPSQYVKQFRNINKDLTNLHQTKFIHGELLETMRFYEGLKDRITQTIEKGTPKSFSNLFKEANKEFSQISRIDKFNQIMENITENGIINANKLNKYITNPRKATIMKKQIGEDGFNKLKLISKDLKNVQNKLKLIKEIDLPDVIKSATTYSVLKFLGLPGYLLKPVTATKKGLEIARGYILTSPQGYRDVTNFLKAVKSGSKKAIRMQLIKMDANIQKHEQTKTTR